MSGKEFLGMPPRLLYTYFLSTVIAILFRRVASSRGTMTPVLANTLAYTTSTLVSRTQISQSQPAGAHVIHAFRMSLNSMCPITAHDPLKNQTS